MKTPPWYVFKEDFTSVETIVANGGWLSTTTGYSKQTKSFYPTGTNNIYYKQIAPQLFRLNVLTICAKVDITASTGTYRSLAHINNSAVEPVYQVGLNNNSNKLFWYQPLSGVSLSSSDFTIGKKQTLCWVCDGTNTVFYQNGTSLGSVVAATSSTTADTNNTFIIGNNSASGTQPFSNSIYTVQLYDYAFTAADALDWHNMAMRG
jgi:hypothetical protein